MNILNNKYLGVNRSLALCVLCVFIGATLRLARFPSGDSPTETDEVGYLSDGLLLLDGETSIHKYAPSGPLTWVSALFAAVRAGTILISNGKAVSGLPLVVRPVAALESSLFELYADMSALRLVVVGLMMVVCLASIAAAYRLGHAFFGLSGGFASGIIVACLPLFVELSTETRPYAIAWAFAILALMAAGTGSPGRQLMSAGIFYGLAVGSHIDMLRLGPIIVLFLQRRSTEGSMFWHDCRKLAITAGITFLLVAPWYLLHLGDNIRQIITVRVLVVGHASPFWRSWISAGIVLPLVVTLAGLLMSAGRKCWAEFVCGLFLAVSVLVIASRPSAHGLQHDGACL